MTSQLNASALHHCGGMGEMVKDLCVTGTWRWSERVYCAVRTGFFLNIYIRFGLRKIYFPNYMCF